MAVDECLYSITPGVPTSTDLFYSVLFSPPLMATVTDEAVCALSVPTGLPPGTFGVYSADYRGFVNEGDTATLRVDHNGTTDSATVAGLQDGLILTELIGSSPERTIDSTITLGLVEFDAPNTHADLESVDYAELGRTTITSVQASIDQLAAGRTAIVTHLNATSDLLRGGNQPFEAPNNFSLLGGFGSYTFGAAAHYNLDGGFSLEGGAALINQLAGGTSANGSLLAGAVLYLRPGVDTLRPFGGVGFNAAGLGMTFSRHYDDGSPSGASAVASTSGALTGAFVEAGVLYTPSPENAIAFSGTLMHNWLSVDGYSETFSTNNLFPVSVASSTDSFGNIKAKVAWTRTVAPNLDLTLSGALGKTFAQNGVSANVGFIGLVTGAPQDDLFAEYGARLGWRLSPITIADVFFFGSTGANTGTHVQIGAGLHTQF